MKKYTLVFLLFLMSSISVAQNSMNDNSKETERVFNFNRSNQEVPFIIKFDGSVKTILNKEDLLLSLLDFHISFNDLQEFASQKFELAKISVGLSKMNSNKWESNYLSDPIGYKEIADSENSGFNLSELVFKIKLKDGEELSGSRLTINLFDKDGSSIHVHSKELF